MIKRYLAIFVLVCCAQLVFAQHPPAWGGGADQHDLSFGFSFTYVDSYYKILKNPNWQQPFLDPQNGNKPVTSQLNSIGSKNMPGFAVGFLTRYSLTEHIEVRATPSLVFADRSLSYTYADPADNVSKSVPATMVDFPIALKIKSDRVGDFRWYMVGGVKYSYAIGSGRGSDSEAALIDKKVKNIQGFGSYEAGLGCDIYFEYFKLSPEFKLSNSFGNVLLHEPQPFTTPINKLLLHTLMVSLYFE